jgi:hypothetical protein
MSIELDNYEKLIKSESDMALLQLKSSFVIEKMPKYSAKDDIVEFRERMAIAREKIELITSEMTGSDVNLRMNIDKFIEDSDELCYFSLRKISNCEIAYNQIASYLNKIDAEMIVEHDPYDYKNFELKLFKMRFLWINLVEAYKDLICLKWAAEDILRNLHIMLLYDKNEIEAWNSVKLCRTDRQIFSRLEYMNRHINEAVWD